MSVSQATGAFVNAFATNQATLSVTNVTVGNYRIFSVKISSISFTATAVSAPGHGPFTRLFAGTDGTGHYNSFWGAYVTATGAQTVTVTYSSTPGVGCELWSSELVWSGGKANWLVSTSGSLTNVSSTTVTWPSLTTANTTDQCYWGFVAVTNTGTAGSTTGFTYSTVNGNGNFAVFDGTVAATTAYQPTGTQAPAGVSFAVGIILKAGIIMPSLRMTQAVKRAKLY